jgi:hypothetical protein
VLNGEALHVFGPAIVPGSTYAIDATCDEVLYSMPLVIETARWGDIVSTNATTPPGPPNAVVDSSDITAVLDKFKNLALSPIKSRADIDPSSVDRLILSSDISRVLDAYSNNPYPFDPPTACGGEGGGGGGGGGGGSEN